MPAKILLKDKDRKFRLLFGEHPHPMWIVDPQECKILEANAAAAALYGYSQEEFCGLPLDAVEVHDENLQSATGPRRHRTSSGGIIEVEIATHTIEYGGHSPS
jgi:PAS domain S-box-containing protein